MNEIQIELINQIEKFCKKNIEPFMEEDDHHGVFRKDIYVGLGQLGLAGLTQPTEFGGANLTVYDLSVVLHEIAKYSVPYAVTLSVSNMVQSIIAQFGNKVQKDKYLAELTSGKEIGAFALSESGAGSDPSSMKTTAKKTSGGYILNGTKMWITSGGIAKTYIVMAKTKESSKEISSFIVEHGTKGFNFGKAEKKMGWRTSPTRELIFENCFIPDSQLLGSEGLGLKISMSTLDKGRIGIGAISNGLSERAISDAIKYTLIRKQFDEYIYDFQGIQFMISDLATEIEASKLLVEKAAKLVDEGKTNSKLCSMAKMKSSDTAMKVTTDAVQLLGGVGYTSEYPLERFMRDAKVLQIVEGTNQIQKIVIARNIKKEFQS